MLVYPEDLYEKLEFNKILERLSDHCMGMPAKNKILKMKVFDSSALINDMLDEILEYQLSIDMQMDFPLYHYESVLEELRLLRTENYVLELESYLRINNHLRLIHSITDFFRDKERKEKLPLLHRISLQIILDPALLKMFDQIFSDEGKIKPTASPELKNIFSAISSKERELDRLFRSIIEKYKRANYLSENLEGFKNSRRVLSVSAENKRKVKGIIHDESATGKTVYIEPQEVVELNNDLFELETQKRHEVYKILRNLSNQLRPHLDDFLLWERILIRYDIIRSKAIFAREYNGTKPKVNPKQSFSLNEIVHPLLYILNQKQDKKTVPYTLRLEPNKPLLVISGPNAGGKTVALKALGLNQLMFQSGMLVAIGDDSEMCVFSKIMIDIGDQQTIEGDLSTYSSRLLNMKFFIEKADKKSLVLIDEFGSGSDPKVGGAIAEGVLDQLVRKSCFGLITTHYSNIKNYAYKSKKILNGAMLFDRDELKPTFRLKVGQPGSSFAFEIADKIGMPEHIINYAKKKAGKDAKTVDRLLIDLQHEKKALEEKLLENYDESFKLKKLIKNYEQMKDELSIKRKKLKLEAKEKKYLNLSEYEKELQKLIRDIKKDKKIETAQAALKEIKQKRKEEKSEMSDLSEAVFKKQIEQVKTLEIGQFVKLRSGGESGKVIGFDDKKVQIEMGIMNFEVPRSEIILANEPIETKTKSITTDTLVNTQTLESKLDIRGYTKMDANDSVEEFLDNALISSLTQVKILHGKGSGVLKKVVWQKAKEYKDIKKIWHPNEDFGGVGVTLISF